MQFEEFLNAQLDEIKSKNLYRNPLTLNYPAAKYFELEGRKILNLCSNNYLCYAEHPEIKQAAIEAINKYGTGSTGSRLITGTTPLHTLLEEKIAQFKNTEAAMFLSCGFIANISTIPALMHENDVIFSDELNHASIIDGIRQAKVDKYIYNHNDLNHLEDLLSANRNKYNKSLIITDTIFSMDGDTAPLKELVDLKKKFNSILMIDEAHATGVFGDTGAGLAQELNLTQDIDIHMGTFSKALGVEGAYIAGSKNLIEYLRHKSRGFIYSTAPSPAIVGAVIQAIELVQQDKERRQKLRKNIDYLKKRLKEIQSEKFCLIPNNSAIFCFIIGNTEETMQFQKKMLEEKNIFAIAIRPPTVKTSRIRLCLNSELTKDELNQIILDINNCLLSL